MKTPRLFTLAFLFALVFVAAPNAWSQSDGSVVDSSQHGAPVDTSQSAVIAEYEMDFDNVFRAVKAALVNLGYPDNYASKKKLMIETGFRMLAPEDDFFEIMSEYGTVPYIRSPGWKSGRAKMLVTFERLDNGKITVKCLGQLSGYEERFTNVWHYWKSNGRLEQEAMDAITATIDKEKAAMAPVSGGTN